MLVRPAQGMMGIIKAGYMRDVGLSTGLVTEDELEEMAKGWQEWAAMEDASVAMMHGEIIIQK